MMPTFLAPHLSQASFLLQFKEPDVKVRFQQGAAEDAFGTFMGSQSQQTNVPDPVDPNVPRIIFGAEKKQITISQVACQLNFNFAKSSLAFEQELGVVLKNIREFAERALKFKAASDFGLTALVLQINFPSNENVTDLQKYLYDRFIKVGPIDAVASTQVQVGFKIGDLFLTIGANVYELRTISFDLGTSVPIGAINLGDQPVSESGISIRVEVNNKGTAPHLRNIAMADPGSLFQACSDFLYGQMESFTGLNPFGVKE